MILEGILTTQSDDGSMHVAPMGPEVDENCTRWTLKPFQTSQTFKNLRSRPSGVFHVIDDSLLLARAVIGQANDWPHRHEIDVGFILEGACHCFALQIVDWDVEKDRALAIAISRALPVERAFFGWNRAKHAIVEIAILASRVRFLPHEFLLGEMNRYAVWVEKTGGQREHEALDVLSRYINANSTNSP